MSKNFRKIRKNNKKCSKTYTDIFDNLIREITLYLPQINKLGYLIQGISQLQILTLIFDLFYGMNELSGESMDDFIYTILKPFSDFINFHKMFDHNNVNILNSVLCTIILLYYALLFSTSFIFGLFVIIDKSFHISISKAWGYVCICHHSIICTPTLSYSLKMVIEYQKGTLKLYTNNNQGLIWIVILSILGTSFSVVSAIIMSKLCYHQLKVKDSAAMKDSHLQVITLFFKIIMTCILCSTQSYTISCLGISIATLLIILRTLLMLQNLPFYNFRMADFYASWSTLIMDMAFISLLSLISHRYIDFPSTSFILSLIIIFPLHKIIVQNMMDARILQAATLPYSEIKSDSQIILKWLYFKRLIRKGAPVLSSFKKIIHHEMFLQGILMEHCESEGRIYLKEYGLEDLFDKNFKKLGEMSSDNYDQLAYIIRRLVLEIGMEKFPDSHLIRLLMVQYIIDRTDLYHQSIFILNALKHKAQNLETKNSIARLEKRMENILQTKCLLSTTSGGDSYKEINILQLIKNEEIYSALNDELQKQTKLHIKFWGLFIENKPKISEIYLLATKIHKYNLKLKTKWGKLIGKYQRSQPKIFLLYGLFNLIVKNRNILGEDLLKTYTNTVKNTHNEDTADLLSSDNILAFDNIVLLVSGQKEDLGVIKTVTQSIEKHLGISVDTLKGANITSLMSPYFKKNHNSFILNYYQMGEGVVLKASRAIYLVNNNGYIVPCNIIVKYSPEIQNGVEYFSVIRPNQSLKQYIFITQDGLIDSFTQEIADLLGLKSKGNKAISISTLCPEFEEINEAINNWELEKLSKQVQIERNEIMSVRAGVASFQLKKDMTYNGKYNTNSITLEDEKNIFSGQIKNDQGLVNFRPLLATEDPIKINKITEQICLNTGTEWQDYIMETEKKENDLEDINQKLSVQKLNVSVNQKINSNNNFNSSKNSQYLIKSQQQQQPPPSTDLTNRQLKKLSNPNKNSYVKVNTINNNTSNNNGGIDTTYIRNKISESQINDIYEKYVMNDTILPFQPLNKFHRKDKLYLKCKIHIEIHQKLHIFKVVELIKPLAIETNRYKTDHNKLDNDEFTRSGSIPQVRKLEDGLTHSDILPVKSLVNLEISENNYISPRLSYIEEEDKNFMDDGDSFEKEFPIAVERDNNNNNKVFKHGIEPKNSPQAGKNLLTRAKPLSTFTEKNSNKQWFFDGPVPATKNGSSNQTKYASKIRGNEVEKILVNKRDKKILRVGGGEEEKTSYNSSNRTRSSHFIMIKIESALDEDFQTSSLKLIFYGTGIFYLINLILLLSSIIYDISNIKVMQNKREIIELANFRVDSLNEVYQNTLIVYEMLSNKINYSWVNDSNLLNYVIPNQTRYSSACSNLAYYNNELRNLLYQIDTDLKDKFYSTQVKMYDFSEDGNQTETNLQQNVFDATLTIIAKCFKFANLDWNTINLKNRDLTFILKNTLNDILLGIENATLILIQDIDKSMDNMLMTNLSFLISMSVCICGLYFLLVKHIHNFNIERETFFSVLLKLDVSDLKMIYMRLAKFGEILRKNYQDNDLISFFNLLQTSNADNTGKKGDPNRKHIRMAQFQGLNRKNILSLLGAFILVGIIFTVFSTIFIELKQFDNIRKVQINKGNYADFSLIKYGQAILSLSNYIIYNGTSTMKNQNINMVLSENLNILNSSGDIVEQFTDNNGNLDPDFSFYLTENFCLFGQNYQRSYCELIDNTPVQMGVIGINNYIASKLVSIKTSFDISERQDIDIEKALNNKDFFNIYAIYYIYMRDAYINISSILKTDFRLEIEKVQITLIILSCCFIVIILITAIISKISIYDTMKNQGNSLKSILKLLPINLLLTSSALKFYMIKTSKKLLDSIKSNL